MGPVGSWTLWKSNTKSQHYPKRFLYKAWGLSILSVLEYPNCASKAFGAGEGLGAFQVNLLVQVTVTSYGHWTDSSFFWASDRKVQGVLPLRMCTVYHSNVIMPGWFYQKTSLCRKALTRLGQGTALLLGRTAGKAPSVVQLTAVKMVDNTNQFNSNFRNRSDLTSCKASISLFLQMCCFEILFALKIFVLKNISGKLR